MEDNYVPYGPEWEKEMMKFTKKQLIDMLRDEINSNASIDEEEENKLRHTDNE